ncbi:hypothetical protein PVAND_010535 [Polypedilum vanderplanki]|uniref:Integrase catalytic domain-containing protein n=1 Tax=Polypedilum vanderplanki TaxID=319348 RepID=A0A9J6CGJ2_POLVA|nr:hypothetical protein PVAND_010535 [Polypedilum vanderplanki]
MLNPCNPRIHISPRDQQVQRVLWRESSDKPMKTYIHQRMLFGPTSSPFTSQCLAEADSLEVHVFCDAGKEAFAAAAYLVAEYKCDRHTSLIMAKAKVTPLKRKTKTEMSEMPRLELTSCLIAARMAETVIKHHHDLSMKRYCWSDSTIALSWITNPNIHLENYAISPVEEILEKTEREDWRHVPSQLNPADIATKFQKFDFSDSQSIWFKGPKFLLQPKHLWPSQENCQHSNESVTPLVCNISNNPKMYPSEGMSLPPIKCEFTADLLIYIPHSIKSNWIKLVRLVGRSLKLMHMVKNLKSKDKQIKLSNKVKCTTERDSWFILEPIEYERATLFIARKMPMEAFKEEYHKLAKGQLVTNQDFLQLRVFMDDQGVLRINSRVALDPKVYPQRYLPFLPRNHFLTEVLLFWYHLKFNHICVEAQVAEIRSKFWIPRLKSEVAKIKRICNYCGYMRANPQPPLMSSLPDYRVNPEMKPFEVIAMDCTGEITIHRHYKPVKVYILLFTCMLTRFVHVHLLDKMDSLAILEAITIFWAAHGPVSKIVTDNGRNFVGAARRLKKDQAEAEITQQLKEKSELLKQQLAEKYNLKWEFLPPYSPWMGGVHERMIKEIKRAIELTVQKKKLSSVELNIAIHEAAHRLNCRPLTANPIEAEDKPVLTPHLLAKQRDGWPLLPSQQNYSYDPEDKKDRLIYHRGRAIADEIMSRFVKEWLPIITRRCKWFKDVEDFKVGDLVLLIDPSKTRNAWPRAKVHEVYAGRNGVVRVIDVKLPNGEIIPRYSVQRAAKLDIKTRSEENTKPTAKENTD